MGTSSTTTTTQKKTHFSKHQSQKLKETTISSYAKAAVAVATTTNGDADASYRRFLTRKFFKTISVSPEKDSWCFPEYPKLISDSLPPPPPQQWPENSNNIYRFSASGSPSSPSPSFCIRFSLGSVSPVMDFTAAGPPPPAAAGHHSSRSFTKFNTALTAGLLSPLSRPLSPSPPPPSTAPPQQHGSSHTLFEMMATEPDIHQRTNAGGGGSPASTSWRPAATANISCQERKNLAMQRISNVLACRSPGNLFNDGETSDIRLTLSSRDGVTVLMNVHRQILLAHSRFFASKLSERGGTSPSSLPNVVEIADCDDIEVYIETLRLMYCKDLRKKLMREDVPRVLGILKVSAAIGFDAGVLSCLEYLEAAPWAEDEEEKVASLLSELGLENVGAGEVLKRVSLELPNGNGMEENGTSGGDDNGELLLKLLHVVLDGKDEKARRDMKALVSKMLHENSSRDDLRKESIYSACDECLKSFKHYFLRAANGDLTEVGQIKRQADNLHWILDILINRLIADDFLITWASEREMSEAHSKIPAVHRFEISRVTSRLFVGIGKGQLLGPKEVRCLLLKTWLVPFYDDFGWMKRASGGLDRYLIEEGLSNTILTLPLAWQREIFLTWFDRFLNSGEDCPNIQRGFEVWWRRAFFRRNDKQKPQPRQTRTSAAAIHNS